MRKSKIGGQAVIEGVMMRGETSSALSVRDEKKRIRVKTWRNKPKTMWNKIPVIRGVLAFFDSMVQGTKIIQDSAMVFGEEEKPSKFETWMAEKLHIDIMKVVTAFAMLLGVALAIGLFILAPSALSRWIVDAAKWTSFSARAWIEAGIKILILYLYILVISLMKDIKRVFMYHGAEHKTINCYEHELDLTVENVKKQRRFHNRCGSTFLFFVVLVSIILFSIIKIDNDAVRVLVRIACLPITAGLAYELLMFVANTNFFLLYPLRLPGMLLQEITTSEPTDDMMEVAIKSFKAVLELDENPELDIYDHFTFNYVVDARREAKDILDKAKVTYDADIEWILAEVTNKKRSELSDFAEITREEYDKIIEITNERATGKPLWQVIGSCNFYGIDLICDERGLIPRPETEELVENIIRRADNYQSCLDVCTGSGAIAIALNKKTNLNVTALDYSDEALMLAKENIEKTNSTVELIKSDMFNNLDDRKFDIIVSNPPYIKSAEIETLQREVREFEPRMALDGGEDGLDFYRVIAKNALKYLNENGIVAVEVGYNQANLVKTLFEENNFVEVEIINDMLGVERIVIGKKNV